MEMNEGRGTCQVCIPKKSAIGWKSTIWWVQEVSEALGFISKRAHQRHFHGEMGEEDELGAIPLFIESGYLVRLKLPSAEVRDGIDDDPGDSTTKVDDLEDVKRRKGKRGGERTSCKTKLMTPVARMSLANQEYQATQPSSRGESEVKSTVP
jgi:hypothetical protein